MRDVDLRVRWVAQSCLIYSQVRTETVACGLGRLMTYVAICWHMLSLAYICQHWKRFVANAGIRHHGVR